MCEHWFTRGSGNYIIFTVRLNSLIESNIDSQRSYIERNFLLLWMIRESQSNNQLTFFTIQGYCLRVTKSSAWYFGDIAAFPWNPKYTQPFDMAWIQYPSGACQQRQKHPLDSLDAVPGMRHTFVKPLCKYRSRGDKGCSSFSVSVSQDRFLPRPTLVCI